jgi:predicted ABC-type sugar transport system permease subunit
MTSRRVDNTPRPTLFESHLFWRNMAVQNTPAQMTNQRLLKFLASGWSWVFLILVLLFFEFYARFDGNTKVNTFLFNLGSVQRILVYTTQILMMALGLTFVIIAAGIDLSIGFTAGLAAVTMAVVVKAMSGAVPFLSFLVGVLAALAITLIPGLVNGLLISRLNVPSFIGTLGMYGIVRGAALLVAGGATVSISNAVARTFGNANIIFGTVPIIVFVAGLITLFCHYLLTYTKFGLYTYAMGGNVNSVVRAGVNTKRLTIILYIMSSLTAGLAGVFYTSSLSAGAVNAGEPLLLNAVAAVFIGGASLTGGSGTITGTVIGSLIIAVIDFGLTFIQLDNYIKFIAVGLIIIVAVLVDQSKDRILRGSDTK